MDLSAKIVELERRLAALEANRGGSLRFGTVTESNTVGSARVQLHDGDEMVSYPVRTLHRRTLKDQDQCLPDIGEQVAVLFAGQGMEEGCVLGAVYSKQDAAPGQDQHMEFYRFEDGTTISYDREAHKFYALIKGDFEGKVEGNLEATVEGETVVEGHKNVTLRSMQVLHLEGAVAIKLRSPSISMGEWDANGGCTARVKADVYLEGLVDQVGDRTQKGDSTLVGSKNHDGNLTQQGNQQVSGNIDAGGTVSGNPVVGCNH